MKRNFENASASSVTKKSKNEENGDAIAEKVLELETVLGQKLQDLKFPGHVKYVYNPLEYASELHAKYVRNYCKGEKEVLFVGMNPGPWGMSQTGVPFGEVAAVKEWFKMSGHVGKPDKEHPERQITGLDCTRSEVSGKRLWELFKEICQTPDNFFRNAYLHNYCPIALMDAKAKNITPADLKARIHFIIQFPVKNGRI